MRAAERVGEMLTLKRANREYGIQLLIRVFSLGASVTEAETIQRHQKGETLDHVRRPPRTGVLEPPLLREA